MGRFRFSVLGLSRSLAVSRARIDARLTEKRKKSTPRPASSFACGIAAKRWFFRRLRIRGHTRPRGKKNLLRNGPELKEALGCHPPEFPRPSAGCSWPALTNKLRHFRVLGQSGSRANRRLARRRNAAYALGPSPCQVVSQRCTKLSHVSIRESHCMRLAALVREGGDPDDISAA